MKYSIVYWTLLSMLLIAASAKEENSGWLPVVGALVGGALAVVATPAVLWVAGFAVQGITGGSLAAYMMSISSPVMSGTIVASLQSAGAAGIGGATTVMISGTGAAIGNSVAKKFRDED